MSKLSANIGEIVGKYDKKNMKKSSRDFFMSFVCKYGFWNCKCQYSRVPSGLHHKLLFAHGEHFIAVFVGLVPAETERSFGTEIADVAVKTRITVHPFLVLV